MGGGIFCYVLQTLQAAAPQLPQKQYPLLHAFSQLARHLSPVLVDLSLPNGNSPASNVQASQVRASLQALAPSLKLPAVLSVVTHRTADCQPNDDVLHDVITGQQAVPTCRY